MKAMRARLSCAAMLVAIADAAPAATIRRTFQVGASVVATGRLSSRTLAGGGSIEVRASGHRSAPAALLENGQARPMGNSPAILPAPAGGDVVVTILY
jgi:hypothetical protein